MTGAAARRTVRLPSMRDGTEPRSAAVAVVRGDPRRTASRRRGEVLDRRDHRRPRRRPRQPLARQRGQRPQRRAQHPCAARAGSRRGRAGRGARRTTPAATAATSGGASSASVSTTQQKSPPDTLQPRPSLTTIVPVMTRSVAGIRTRPASSSPRAVSGVGRNVGHAADGAPRPHGPPCLTGPRNRPVRMVAIDCQLRSSTARPRRPRCPASATSTRARSPTRSSPGTSRTPGGTGRRGWRARRSAPTCRRCCAPSTSRGRRCSARASSTTASRSWPASSSPARSTAATAPASAPTWRPRAA